MFEYRGRNSPSSRGPLRTGRARRRRSRGARTSVSSRRSAEQKKTLAQDAAASTRCGPRTTCSSPISATRRRRDRSFLRGRTSRPVGRPSRQQRRLRDARLLRVAERLDANGRDRNNITASAGLDGLRARNAEAAAARSSTSPRTRPSKPIPTWRSTGPRRRSLSSRSRGHCRSSSCWPHRAGAAQNPGPTATRCSSRSADSQEYVGRGLPDGRSGDRDGAPGALRPKRLLAVDGLMQSELQGIFAGLVPAGIIGDGWRRTWSGLAATSRRTPASGRRCEDERRSLARRAS